MLTEERQSKIIEMVNRQGSVQLTELCDTLGISESTARRDLKELDSRKLLVRVHGGAVTKDEHFFNLEANVEEKSEINREAKKLIAEYAASIIEDGDFVFIDAGTTTDSMIEFLDNRNVTYVTNGLAHALKMAKKGLKVHLTGGEVKAVTEALIGSECVLDIKRMNFTKCFLGVNGISIGRGFTTPDFNEASIKIAVLDNTKDAYILADSSKFDKVTAITFAELSSAGIITDELPGKKYRDEAKIINTK